MILSPFPGTECLAITSLTVEAMRIQPQQMRLVYRLTGDLSALLIPGLANVPTVTLGLWQHTCFELFYRAPGAVAYAEYNFSPSLDWDHYQFSAYRYPATATLKRAPQLALLQHDAGQLTLEAIVPLPHTDPLDIGLTAVIEDIKGGITYYALAHTGEKPDFHAPEGFALRL